MLGSLLDIASNSKKFKATKIPKTIEQYNFSDPDAKEYWVCFLPDVAEKSNYLKKRLILCHKNADIYILPEAETIIQPDPKKTRSYLEKIILDATKKTKKTK
jgi:hypothetical protein